MPFLSVKSAPKAKPAQVPAQAEFKPVQKKAVAKGLPPVIWPLQEKYDFHLACPMCFIKESEGINGETVTYSVQVCPLLLVCVYLPLRAIRTPKMFL